MASRTCSSVSLAISFALLVAVMRARRGCNPCPWPVRHGARACGARNSFTDSTTYIFSAPAPESPISSAISFGSRPVVRRCGGQQCGDLRTVDRIEGDACVRNRCGLFLMSLAVSAAVALSMMELPRDLLIFWPSRPGISGASDRMALRLREHRVLLGVTLVEAAGDGAGQFDVRQADPCPPARYCPCRTGCRRPDGPGRSAADRSVRGRKPPSRTLTVGLRCSSDSVTSDRNGSMSWFSAGTEECV